MDYDISDITGPKKLIAAATTKSPLTQNQLQERWERFSKGPQANLINKLYAFLENLEGMPYKGGDYEEKSPEGPFWFGNDEIPRWGKIAHDGVNCLGLINIVLRFLGVGATYNPVARFDGKLVEFDNDISYPPLTLLLRRVDPENPDHDPGHNAIVWKDMPGMDKPIIHSYVFEDEDEDWLEVLKTGRTTPGVVIEPIAISNDWHSETDNEYHYAVYPWDWIHSSRY